jgi:glycopeptide antibiotics resistance protein
MKITPDKWKHFWVGIAMGLVLQALGWWLLPLPVLAISIIVLIIIIAISYGFELFSKITGFGYHEILDAVFSIAGGLIGMGIILIFQLN